MAAIKQEASVRDVVNGREPRQHHHRARRVLLFPLPFQGHINPMLQLGDVLHGRGLAVTVLHTRFNALDPALHPDFHFVSVPDGVTPAASGGNNIIEIILAMNEAMEASTSVDEVLKSVIAAEEGRRPACLFIDGNLLAVQKAAARLGLPTLVLRTGSAACLGYFLAMPKLYEMGYLPRKDSQLHMPVKELPPLRVRDLFFSINSSHEKVRKVLARIVEAVKGSSGVLINTFEALETKELERIRCELDDDLSMVLAAGPLHKMSSMSTGSSLLHQDYSCLEWLDTQPVRSVLYVSFGSLASMNCNEFLEVAWGLANSHQHFLWVVRPGMIDGTNGLDLPDGFYAAVEGRGKLIQWAPQQEVLAHQAVGGFWTHNGWNSTLESISEGVPMLCRPHFADQMMNARYVEEIWGVGFELEDELERGKIEIAIRNLMNGRKGAEMRERAQELKTKVLDSLKENGSSHIVIDKLVKYILSM